MDRLIYSLLVILFCGSVYAQEQKTMALPQQIKTEELQKSPKSTTNSMIHKFVCQRCGSENQLDWGFPVKNRSLELIPHCVFCGKKYWPKFKPTGLLERTYCQEDHKLEGS